jgi:transposase
MIQITPQMRILVAREAVDFRKGIDGLCSVCRQIMQENPLSGYVFVFRNRSGTSIKLLMYDGQGFWLCQKRWSSGRLTWWPRDKEQKMSELGARQLQVVLWNGNPDKVQMAPDWKPIASSAVLS